LGINCNVYLLFQPERRVSNALTLSLEMAICADFFGHCPTLRSIFYIYEDDSARTRLFPTTTYIITF